jgi:hypothetical protein
MQFLASERRPNIGRTNHDLQQGHGAGDGHGEATKWAATAGRGASSWGGGVAHGPVTAGGAQRWQLRELPVTAGPADITSEC